MVLDSTGQRQSAWAVERPELARLWPSLADTTYSKLRKPELVARSAPRTFATSAEKFTSGYFDANSATCSTIRPASAIDGTADSETSAVASTRRIPVAISRSAATLGRSPSAYVRF